MVGSAPDLLYGRMYTYHLDQAPYAPYAPYARDTTFPSFLRLNVTVVSPSIIQFMYQSMYRHTHFTLTHSHQTLLVV